MSSDDDESNRLRESLLGPKSDESLSLKELTEASRILFGKEDRFQLYGLDPAELHAAGCNVVGRTAIECKIDAQCRPVAQAVAAVVADLNSITHQRVVVCDPFVGSGNMLYNVANTLNAASSSFGFELTPAVAKRTLENLQKMGFEGDVKQGSFDTSGYTSPHAGATVVVIVDPPWGDGFEFGRGLVLDKTSPTVPAVLEHASGVFAQAARVIYVVCTTDQTDEDSVQRLLKDYQLLARGAGTELPEGYNGGYVIVTKKKRDEANELRQSLLGPQKNVIISAEEIRNAGRIFFGDEDKYKLYGRNPDELKAAGCVLVGRTVIEAQIDAQCAPVSKGVKEFLQKMDRSQVGSIIVLDIFAGSANLLFHVAKALDATTAIGVELDPYVAKSTKDNIGHLGFSSCNLIEGSFMEKSEPVLSLLPDGKKTLFVIVAPPWADAFEFGTGLVLDRTEPSTPDVLEYASSTLSGVADTRVLFVILISDLMDNESVERVLRKGPYKQLGRGHGSELPVGANAGYILCELIKQ
eukprot:scaffold161832_cov35-Attheya_sp.AAC.1